MRRSGIIIRVSGVRVPPPLPPINLYISMAYSALIFARCTKMWVIDVPKWLAFRADLPSQMLGPIGDKVTDPRSPTRRLISESAFGIEENHLSRRAMKPFEVVDRDGCFGMICFWLGQIVSDHNCRPNARARPSELHGRIRSRFGNSRMSHLDLSFCLQQCCC